jgi:D-alanyl-lipoteichoic acid acyltransferase DltB (MBOAT superfamily)
MDFFINNINVIFQKDYELLNIALPLAISFFTIQQIIYIINRYEGLITKQSLINYFLFVSFFPQLIAGPIMHYKKLMPQFDDIKNININYKNVFIGVLIFSIGLFKKIIIADNLAPISNYGFDETDYLDFLNAWKTSLSYTFQLYFDFSGYIDMAVGSALIFNIKLPANFNSPFKSTGMIDFWKRWHITLTNFITNYIYTPLIKSFKKLDFTKAMFSTLVAFLIAGLWHGASWMFVIFGFLNGLGIVFNHIWQKKIKKIIKIEINNYLSWFITFNFINITFIFFRANNFADAIKILKGMVNFNHFINYFHKLNILVDASFDGILILSCFFIVLFFKNSYQIIDDVKFNSKYLLYIMTLTLSSLTVINKNNEFIYFNF